jgi:hypothetical protein
MILLKTFPIAGPNNARTTITTTATKTRINAYSTKPWPFSFGANNMAIYLLSIKILKIIDCFFIITTFFINSIDLKGNQCSLTILRDLSPLEIHIYTLEEFISTHISWFWPALRVISNELRKQ